MSEPLVSTVRYIPVACIICGHKDELRSDLVEAGDMRFWCDQCEQGTVCAVEISAAPGEAHLNSAVQTKAVPVDQCTRGGARRELTSVVRGSKSVT